VFFSDWPSLLRPLATAPLAYLALVITLRVAGKRTLSKLNAFDFVVTVAFGSLLATVALSRDVPLAEGVVVLVAFTLLQFVVSWLSQRVRGVSLFVKARPTLLLRDGELLDDALRAQRVTHEEVLQVVRQKGVASLEDVYAVVIETDGSMSVISQGRATSSALSDVEGW
jgi:uncharacterized membrane protein YcaP (DUF421 family)